MKLIFLLIAIPIISSTNHYFDLNDAQSKTFKNLTSGENYYFYIYLGNKKFPKVGIKFIMKTTCSEPFNRINVYEYSSLRDSQDYKYSKHDNESVNYHSIGQKISAKLGIVAKQIFNFETSYVAFAINPNFS
jgi:hypothetical protein